MNAPDEPDILIDISRQRLQLREAGRVLLDYSVSTAANGPGEEQGSECTPRGLHTIRARIGEGCAANSVFVGRRLTGEIYTPELGVQNPERDWVLSRILWLSGCEPGRNRFGSVDTLRRYIYIHATPDSEPMGVAKSHGCIRMRSSDLIELFGRVAVGTRVEIVERVETE